MVNLYENRVRLGSKKIRVRPVAGTTLRGYDLTSIPDFKGTSLRRSPSFGQNFVTVYDIQQIQRNVSAHNSLRPVS